MAFYSDRFRKLSMIHYFSIRRRHCFYIYIYILFFCGIFLKKFVWLSSRSGFRDRSLFKNFRDEFYTETLRRIIFYRFNRHRKYFVKWNNLHVHREISLKMAREMMDISRSIHLVVTHEQHANWNACGLCLGLYTRTNTHTHKYTHKGVCKWDKRMTR